jgi:hypothetical protein
VYVNNVAFYSALIQAGKNLSKPKIQYVRGTSCILQLMGHNRLEYNPVWDLLNFTVYGAQKA